LEIHPPVHDSAVDTTRPLFRKCRPTRNASRAKSMSSLAIAQSLPDRNHQQQHRNRCWIISSKDCLRVVLTISKPIELARFTCKDSLSR
jgi:hypothetical protein